MTRRKALKKVLEEVDVQVRDNQETLRQAYQEGIRALYPHAVSALKKSPHKRAEILVEDDSRRGWSDFSYVLQEDGQVIKRHRYTTREVRNICGIQRTYHLVEQKDVVETLTLDDFIEPLDLHDLEDVQVNLRQHVTTLQEQNKAKKKEERPEDTRQSAGYQGYGLPPCLR